MTAKVRRALAEAERFAVALRVAAPTAWECFVKRLPLLLITVVLVPLATAAHAQGDNKAYCAQLVDLYRRYVPHGVGGYHWTCVLVSEIKRNIIVEQLCAANGKTPEYISEEKMAYMATHGDAVMYPKLVKKTG